jgi:hypothetical protein
MTYGLSQDGVIMILPPRGPAKFPAFEPAKGKVISIIPATGTLAEVSADCTHIAQLEGCRGLQGLVQERPLRNYGRVLFHCGERGQGPKAKVRPHGDPLQGMDPLEIDQAIRSPDSPL